MHSPLLSEFDLVYPLGVDMLFIVVYFGLLTLFHLLPKKNLVFILNHNDFFSVIFTTISSPPKTLHSQSTGLCLSFTFGTALGGSC